MTQFTLKTTDKDLLEYINSQSNVSKMLKEAVLLHKVKSINPIEEKEIIPIVRTTKNMRVLIG